MYEEVKPILDYYIKTPSVLLEEAAKEFNMDFKELLRYIKSDSGLANMNRPLYDKVMQLYKRMPGSRFTGEQVRAMGYDFLKSRGSLESIADTNRISVERLLSCFYSYRAIDPDMSELLLIRAQRFID